MIKRLIELTKSKILLIIEIQSKKSKCSIKLDRNHHSLSPKNQETQSKFLEKR